MVGAFWQKLGGVLVLQLDIVLIQLLTHTSK